VCTNNTCTTTPGRCLDNEDCAPSPATPVCDPSQDLCVECLSDADCQNDFTCDSETEMCIPPGSCSTNADCAPFSQTRVCDPGPGICVQCLVQLDCDPGQDCENDVCVNTGLDGCSPSNPCPNSSFCAVADGGMTCESSPPCTTTEDCVTAAPGTLCVNAECSNCASSTSCEEAAYPSGDVCWNGLCMPSSSCDPECMTVCANAGMACEMSTCTCD
jgi:hypothetical protein